MYCNATVSASSWISARLQTLQFYGTITVMALADIWGCISYSGKTSISSLNAVNQWRQIIPTPNLQSLLYVYVSLHKTGTLRVVSHRLGGLWASPAFPGYHGLPLTLWRTILLSVEVLIWIKTRGCSAGLQPLKNPLNIMISMKYLLWKVMLSHWKLQNWYLNRLKFIVVAIFLHELFIKGQNVKQWTLNMTVGKATFFGRITLSSSSLNAVSFVSKIFQL